MKDRTPIVHAVVALAMQAVLGIATGNPWIGATFAIGWFVSREHAQREAAIFPRGKYVPEQWWRGFTGWSADRWWDALLPAVCVIVVALAVEALRHA